jgi:hypothetical protein
MKEFAAVLEIGRIQQPTPGLKIRDRTGKSSAGGRGSNQCRMRVISADS